MCITNNSERSQNAAASLLNSGAAAYTTGSEYHPYTYQHPGCIAPPAGSSGQYPAYSNTASAASANGYYEYYYQPQQAGNSGSVYSASAPYSGYASYDASATTAGQSFPVAHQPASAVNSSSTVVGTAAPAYVSMVSSSAPSPVGDDDHSSPVSPSSLPSLHVPDSSATSVLSSASTTSFDGSNGSEPVSPLATTVPRYQHKLLNPTAVVSAPPTSVVTPVSAGAVQLKEDQPSAPQTILPSHMLKFSSKKMNVACHFCDHAARRAGRNKVAELISCSTPNCRKVFCSRRACVRKLPPHFSVKGLEDFVKLKKLIDNGTLDFVCPHCLAPATCAGPQCSKRWRKKYDKVVKKNCTVNANQHAAAAAQFQPQHVLQSSHPLVSHSQQAFGAYATAHPAQQLVSHHQAATFNMKPYSGGAYVTDAEVGVYDDSLVVGEQHADGTAAAASAAGYSTNPFAKAYAASAVAAPSAASAVHDEYESYSAGRRGSNPFVTHAAAASSYYDVHEVKPEPNVYYETTAPATAATHYASYAPAYSTAAATATVAAPASATQAFQQYEESVVSTSATSAPSLRYHLQREQAVLTKLLHENAMHQQQALSLAAPATTASASATHFTPSSQQQQASHTPAGYSSYYNQSSQFDSSSYYYPSATASNASFFPHAAAGSPSFSYVRYPTVATATPVLSVAGGGSTKAPKRKLSESATTASVVPSYTMPIKRQQVAC